MLLQFIANGLCAGSLYVIVALGFGLIYTTTKIFHFAHGGVYVSSAYMFYYLFAVLNINLLLALICSLLFGALVGILIELFVYSPMSKRKISPEATMISSFGVYLFIVNTIPLFAGNETKVLNPGIDKTVVFGSVILTSMQIWAIIAFLIIIAIVLVFRKLKSGQIILAYANNPKLMEILGWSSSKIRIVIFGVGSLLAGLSACLMALDVGIDPNIGMSALLMSAIAVIIGGVKYFEGAIIGGLLLGILQSLVVWQFSARWMEAFTFIVLIVFLLFRPQGLLGRKLRVEESK